MNSKEELYDSFAELLFSIAMADGEIDEEETQELNRLIGNHPLRSRIDNLMKEHDEDSELSIVKSYKSTLSLCKQLGTDSEYAFLIKVLEDFSKVSKSEEDDEEEDLNEVIIEGLKQQLLK